jgi:hypothetical protein
MGEDLDPLTTDSTVEQISHRGILIVMFGLIVVGAVIGFAAGGNRFGFGVLFGGILSFANYFWLERSTRSIFDQTALATTGILAVKYILRYVAIGLVLLLVYITNAFPVAAVIMGLASFAFAVVIQGLKNIFTSTF